MKAPGRGRVAIVASACRFPDAQSSEMLWRNVSEGRRSFRSIPPGRLNLADYAREAIVPELVIPQVLAGLLTDWEFPRLDHNISKVAFGSADLSHWLALETALDLINEVGALDASSRDRTGVIIGNTLTGEFSRSAQVLLRSPYLDRLLSETLAQHAIEQEAANSIRQGFFNVLAADFAAPNEETLAGALANTIAGRIANHLDLHGGAWTIDGACASSLLAVADACTKISEGVWDFAIVGGVDLSLDPFELIGFARMGALATEDMRVFDRSAAGFWPGEGCGIVMLASVDAVRKKSFEPIAWIDGWGVSTDGAGGLTRPSIEGQLRALRRAYKHAGIDPVALGYVEAHGTGTAVGDPVEISALSTLLAANDKPVAIGSIKANIGHTKAASGVAGLIKSIGALNSGMVPPHISCIEPNPAFKETGNRLTPARQEHFPGVGRRIAGVSGFGFGGVNAHIVLSKDSNIHLSNPPRPIAPQDYELFLFTADSRGGLTEKIERFAERAETFSLAELADAASALASMVDYGNEWRAAITAKKPNELGASVNFLLEELQNGRESIRGDGLFASRTARDVKIGFVFPGQAAPARNRAPLWEQCFPWTQQFFEKIPTARSESPSATEFAQPAITVSTLVGIELLSQFGVSAVTSVGHSLGELSALYWAGAIDGEDIVRLASERGRIMASLAQSTGAMVSVSVGLAHAKRIADQFDLSIACINSEHEIVLAGDVDRVEACINAMRAEKLQAIRLNVSHAFHTGDFREAGAEFRAALRRYSLSPVQKRVFSTVSAEPIPADSALDELLMRQMTSVIRFSEAMNFAALECDFFIEVGPGAGLTRVAASDGHDIVSTDIGGASLKPMLDALAYSFCRGVDIDSQPLSRSRPIREISFSDRPRLLSNPCGLREGRSGPRHPSPISLSSVPVDELEITSLVEPGDGSLGEAICRFIAEELGLSNHSVTLETRFLEDLHLNSLAVSRIAANISKEMRMPPPSLATDYSRMTIGDLVCHIEELKVFKNSEDKQQQRISGVAPWSRRYRRNWARWSGSPARPKSLDWKSDGSIQTKEQIGEIRPDKLEGEGRIFRIGPIVSGSDLLSFFSLVQAASQGGCKHIAIAHHGLFLCGFANSLIKEKAFDSIFLVDVSAARNAEIDARILNADAACLDLRVLPNGEIEQATLELDTTVDDQSGCPICAEDVVLVTGGARGIAAECALKLGAATGATLILVGRSHSNDDAVVRTMARAIDLGINAHYESADVGDGQSLSAAIDRAERITGPVTCVIHAAGANDPKQFSLLEADEVERCIRPKVSGLYNLIDCIRTRPIKLLVGFGSIIGHEGLAGETHYALANGALSSLIENWAAENPSARAISFDWSVWAGPGMGERLGAVERLEQIGVDAIPLNAALEEFMNILLRSRSDGALVVTSRFGLSVEDALEQSPLPLSRFLENVQVYYPGVELVVDAKVSIASDPYLLDHVINGLPVMPGVMMLEAMAQAAIALSSQTTISSIFDIAFNSAFTVAEQEAVTLRMAALAEQEIVTVHLLSSQDDFATVVASARFIVQSAFETPSEPSAPPFLGDIEYSASGLYGALLFGAGRFKSIDRYRHLSAVAIVADLSQVSTKWFAQYYPSSLVLGDPALRDGGIHSLQAAVPQRRVVPVSVRQIRRFGAMTSHAQSCAFEVRSTSDEFVFNIRFLGRDGEYIEEWTEATFASIDALPVTGLPAQLLSVGLQRAIMMDTGSAPPTISIKQVNGVEDRRRSALADVGVVRLNQRGDGAPEPVGGDRFISIAHTTTAACVVSKADAPVTCDMVAAKEAWQCEEALSVVDRDVFEKMSAAYPTEREIIPSILWCARECMRKHGIRATTPIRKMEKRNDGSWRMAAEDALIFSMSSVDFGTVNVLVASEVVRHDEHVSAMAQRGAPC